MRQSEPTSRVRSPPRLRSAWSRTCGMGSPMALSTCPAQAPPVPMPSAIQARFGSPRQDDGEGLGRMALGEEHDDAGDQPDHDIAEQRQQHREGGRPHGVLEVQQPGGERGPARDEEGQREHREHPQQPEAERRGHIGAEADGGRRAELRAELVGECRCRREIRKLCRAARASSSRKHQPAHGRSGDPAEQLPVPATARWRSGSRKTAAVTSAPASVTDSGTTSRAASACTMTAGVAAQVRPNRRPR